VTGFLSNIFGYIKDFLAGIWNKITSISKSILDTCTSGARILASTFGFSFKLADFVPGANVAAGDVKSYTGKVVWELSVGLKVARTQLGDIIDNLTANRSVGVASQQLAIEDVSGQGLVIVGSVNFGAQSAAIRQGISGVQDISWLRALFEKSVRECTQGMVLRSESPSLLDPSSHQLAPKDPDGTTTGSSAEEEIERRKAAIRQDLKAAGLVPSDLH
jgi:hypothetical protein